MSTRKLTRSEIAKASCHPRKPFPYPVGHMFGWWEYLGEAPDARPNERTVYVRCACMRAPKRAQNASALVNGASRKCKQCAIDIARGRGAGCSNIRAAIEARARGHEG